MTRMLDTPPPVVFVVDDDPAVCSSLKFALELEGFAVNTYANGETFLSDADLSGAGCLIIDYRLPGMSGTELLAELRRRSVDVPALLITSNPTPALEKAVARLGVQIIEKPLLSNALSECVRDICRVSGLRH